MSAYDKQLENAIKENDLAQVIESIGSLATCAGLGTVESGDGLAATYYARELLKSAMRKEQDAVDMLSWSRPARARLEQAYNMLISKTLAEPRSK